MKYRKIGGSWVSGGAESSGSSGMEWNREKGEKQRKNRTQVTCPMGAQLTLLTLENKTL